MDYPAALNRILQLVDLERLGTSSPGQASGEQARYDLRRTNALLGLLGSPQEGRATVHVAGTKGKGSTAALCASTLHQQGYRTGLYTSPHLHTFRERISVDGTPIAESDFASLIEDLWGQVQEVSSNPDYGGVTLFEFLTSMALFHFNNVGTQFNVLEVGLGGRLDATNVVTPQVCVITSISLDHTSVLGDTVELIAREKAGIIKSGVPVVSAPQSPEAADVIRSVCREKGATLVEVGKDVTWKTGACQIAEAARAAQGQQLTVKGRLGCYDLWIPLLGDFQGENAATAAATLEVLMEQGHQVSPAALRDGFARVHWPCRMEVLDPGTCGPLVVADGAHNPHSAARLRDSLPSYFDYDRVVLVIGISSDKNLKGIVAELAQMEPLVIATRSRHPRAAPTSTLVEAFRPYGIQAFDSKDSGHALEAAIERATDRDIVLVTGSLFVAAEVREVIMGIKPELYPELAVG